MELEAINPKEIYSKINEELAQIIGELRKSNSNDENLDQQKKEAHRQLQEFQEHLQTQLESLERNAEWKTFTIAFYGETGAGKSTIIETLRILLKEPTKLESQRKFREFREKYGLNEEELLRLQQKIEQVNALLVDLAQKAEHVLQPFEQEHGDIQNRIIRLQAIVSERKKAASLWEKILNIFRKLPEETELKQATRQLQGIVEAREHAAAAIRAQQVDAEQQKAALDKQHQQSLEHLAKLEALGDGEIIGDGRADFTRETQRYDFELQGQPFALLDVPGIEGSEGKVLKQIEQAVQTAHAVFYVTNQAAPPQTGDIQRKGTLEKIKEHLGAQTEVWTIFNKKITNPKHALIGRPLISDDERASLAGLDEKMRQQLGDSYREVVPLTALPAFLASTDHFAPNSLNAKRRGKILADFSPEELLQKSQIQGFLNLLGGDLISSSKAKITRANFKKANEELKKTIELLCDRKEILSELAEKLNEEGQSAQTQLTASFRALQVRLESTGNSLIDKLASNVRNQIYERIDNEIGNDEFKDALADLIENEIEILSEELPPAMEEETKHFQREVQGILERLKENMEDLADHYEKINKANLNGSFDLKINIDNGLKIGNLVAVVVGGALMFWNPGGWAIIAMGALSIAVGAYKAVRGFLSSNYRKAQQRKAAEENLEKVTDQLRESLNENLERVIPEIAEKVSIIEKALATPGQHAEALVTQFGHSISQLKSLSRQIENAGAL